MENIISGAGEEEYIPIVDIVHIREARPARPKIASVLHVEQLHNPFPAVGHDKEALGR